MRFAVMSLVGVCLSFPALAVDRHQVTGRIEICASTGVDFTKFPRLAYKAGSNFSSSDTFTGPLTDPVKAEIETWDKKVSLTVDDPFEVTKDKPCITVRAHTVTGRMLGAVVKSIGPEANNLFVYDGQGDTYFSLNLGISDEKPGFLYARVVKALPESESKVPDWDKPYDPNNPYPSQAELDEDEQKYAPACSTATDTQISRVVEMSATGLTHHIKVFSARLNAIPDHDGFCSAHLVTNAGEMDIRYHFKIVNGDTVLLGSLVR